jgi:hypothetical protein
MVGRGTIDDSTAVEFVEPVYSQEDSEVDEFVEVKEPPKAN